MILKSFLEVNEAGTQLLANMSHIGFMDVFNPSATVDAYLKIFITSAEPTYASDVPTHAFTISPGRNTIQLHASLTPCYMQASTNKGAGATAPDEDLDVVISYQEL